MFKEINNQPDHIREIFMWLCVVIVFSSIALVGFRQTEKRLVALVNPEAQEKNKEKATKFTARISESPLGDISIYFKDLKAAITDIFNINFSRTLEEGNAGGQDKVEISPALLPLAGEK